MGRGSAGIRTGSHTGAMRHAFEESEIRREVAALFKLETLSVNREFGRSLFTFNHSNLQLFMVNPTVIVQVRGLSNPEKTHLYLR